MEGHFDSFCLYSRFLSPKGKMKLWMDLLYLKGSMPGGSWILEGDFNLTKLASERKQSSRILNSPKMAEFGSFIHDMEQVDLPDLSNKFTWFNSSKSCMSMINHILVSNVLIDIWWLKGKFMGDLSNSDHCPISIKSNK